MFSRGMFRIKLIREEVIIRLSQLEEEREILEGISLDLTPLIVSLSWQHDMAGMDITE